MCVLPVPGGPEQQQPTFEVLTGVAQRIAVTGDAERVPLHAGQHRFGQNHVVACGHRNVTEGERYAAHRTHADIEHVPAIHVQPAPQLSEFGVYRLRTVDGQAGDLYRQPGLVLGRPHDHDDV